MHIFYISVLAPCMDSTTCTDHQPNITNKFIKTYPRIKPIQRLPSKCACTKHVFNHRFMLPHSLMNPWSRHWR